jgi:hypothetical protein
LDPIRKIYRNIKTHLSGGKKEHISTKKISRRNLAEKLFKSESGNGSGRFQKSDPYPVKKLSGSASTVEEIWPKNYLGQNQATDPEQDPEPDPEAELDPYTEPKPNPETDPDVFKCRIRTFSKVGSGRKPSGSASTPCHVT